MRGTAGVLRSLGEALRRRCCQNGRGTRESSVKDAQPRATRELSASELAEESARVAASALERNAQLSDGPKSRLVTRIRRAWRVRIVRAVAAKPASRHVTDQIRTLPVDTCWFGAEPQALERVASDALLMGCPLPAAESVSLSATFPPQAGSVGATRAFVAALMTDHHLQEVVALLVSELDERHQVRTVVL